MTKLQYLSLIALLCFISTIAVVVDADDSHFSVEGKVYCDTCRAGFVTSKTEYIEGAKVMIECHNRTTHKKTFEGEGVTDETGKYTISVPNDHEDEVCEVHVLSSPVEDCNEIKKPVYHARVVLTHNNGIASDVRYANALSFMKKKPLPGCSELLAKYVLSDESAF